MFHLTAAVVVVLCVVSAQSLPVDGEEEREEETITYVLDLYSI